MDRRRAICFASPMAKSATLRLKNDDAALVLCGNGKLKLTLPAGQPGDQVPDHAVLLMAIAERLEHDPEFADDLMEHMQDCAGEQFDIAPASVH